MTQSNFLNLQTIEFMWKSFFKFVYLHCGYDTCSFFQVGHARSTAFFSLCVCSKAIHLYESVSCCRTIFCRCVRSNYSSSQFIILISMELSRHIRNHCACHRSHGSQTFPKSPRELVLYLPRIIQWKILVYKFSNLYLYHSSCVFAM
jgi:hypothetical protein